jgi:hypothetical protein
VGEERRRIVSEIPRKWDEKDRCQKCGFIPGYPYPPWEEPPRACECRRPAVVVTAPDVVGETRHPLRCPTHDAVWSTIYRDGGVEYECGCGCEKFAEVRDGPYVWPRAVPLCEARTGIFRTLDGAYGFKTEYTRPSSVSRSKAGLGAIEAYCLESGETWWGDPPQTAESQRAQLVVPVDLLAHVQLLSSALAEAADGLSRADRPRLARQAREVLGHVERGTPMESRKSRRKRRKS